MWIEKVIFLILMILPYGFIGFDLGNIIALTLGIIYIFFKGRIVGNKKFILIATLYFFIGIITVLIGDKQLNSIVGVAPYLSILVYYVVFNNIFTDDRKVENLIKYIVYVISVISIIFIIIQCKIFDVRLEGAIGYANSYALILLITIYLNNKIVINNNKFINIILVTSLLFTGSRTTMICYVVYLAFELYKKDYNYIKNSILNNLIGVILYILLEGYIGILLLILPFIIVGINQLYKIRLKKKLIVALSLACVLFVIFIPNNTFERIKNISINNGSLQERLVLFEDGINAIINKPMGYGINSYEREIVYSHTANYQYNYVHNSILQVGFETGIIGAIMLLLIFIYGGKLIYVNNGFNIDFIIYTLFILHSFMDFDFSFVSVIALFTLLISVNDKNRQSFELERKSIIRLGCLFISAILIFIGINEGMSTLVKTVLNKGEYEKAKKIISKIPIKDYKTYSILGDTYKVEYDITNKEEALIKSLDYNKKSLERDIRNSNIKWNIAYCYKELGDIEKYIESMKDLSEANKYNKEYYDEFYNTISSLNVANKYDEILSWIKNELDQNKNNINSKSIYMKNQI